MTEGSQESTKSLVASALAHFVNDGSLYVFPIIYVFLILSHGLDQTLVAVLASLTSLSAIVAAPFVGRRSDVSQNYGSLMALGMVIMAVAIFGDAISFLYFYGFVLFVFLVPFACIIG